jgi:hypothetical protein
MNVPDPTLNELSDFIKTNPDYFGEDEKKYIRLYFENTKEKYSNGKYWLKGQLEMTPDEKITIEKMNTAIEIDNRRKIEYGGPCNGLEAMSILQHEKKFENLQNVLQKYYEILEEEYFRPPKPSDPTDTGGLFYQQIAENTLVGK